MKHMNQNTAVAVQAKPAIEAPRLTQVQEQVGRSMRLMASIDERMNSLYVRLQPVLSEAQKRSGESGTPKPTLVGHAQALSNHNDQLEVFLDSLGDLLDRLEL
jgi:hypothetical protein